MTIKKKTVWCNDLITVYRLHYVQKSSVRVENENFCFHTFVAYNYSYFYADYQTNTQIKISKKKKRLNKSKLMKMGLFGLNCK